MSKVTNEQVQQVRRARWEVWRQMAKDMKNHQVLAVELLRTQKDQTIAVFTVVRNGEPVQFLVRGDSRGRLLVDNADQGGEHHHHHDHHHGHHHGHHDHGHHEHGDHGDRGYAVQSAQLEGGQMMAMMALAATDDPASPDFMAGGDPPPKQPPPPGFTAAGGVMLGTAFDVAENLPTNGAPPK
jgi:ABC-type Zn2+ transport system substrate-binding protein/surface adhesin